MEALMAIDEDDAALPDETTDFGTEEIVFDHGEKPPTTTPAAAADTTAGNAVNGESTAAAQDSSSKKKEISTGLFTEKSSFDGSDDMDAMLFESADFVEELPAAHEAPVQHVVHLDGREGHEHRRRTRHHRDALCVVVQVRDREFVSHEGSSRRVALAGVE